MLESGIHAHNERDALLHVTRRHFFQQCGYGLGALALGTLLGRDASAASITAENPLAPKLGHFPARAKNVIFLFMAGGPSQLELYDYKPKLQELNGQPVPKSFMEGKRFAFMDTFLQEPPARTI